MKYYALIVSTIIPAFSYAMEQEIEIRNRDLNTLQNPHITIINKLPKDAAFSTRIDISDKTKINSYTKDSYRSDESTKTIWPEQGIRFSPYYNKNGQPEHKRLGMNDVQNAALIALYIHGVKHSLKHILVGEDTKIKFGDTIIITVNNDRIVAEMPNNNLLDLYASLTQSPEDNYLILPSQKQVVYLSNTFLNGKTTNCKYFHRLLFEWEIAMNEWEDFFEYIPKFDDNLQNSSSERYEFSEYTDSSSYESSEYSESSSSENNKTPEYSSSSYENYETSESSK